MEISIFPKQDVPLNPPRICMTFKQRKRKQCMSINRGFHPPHAKLKRFVSNSILSTKVFMLFLKIIYLFVNIAIGVTFFKVIFFILKNYFQTPPFHSQNCAHGQPSRLE